MAEVEKTSGLIDLEKELSCSVSPFPESWLRSHGLRCSHSNSSLTVPGTDLYRDTLSAAHSIRLPSYILRLVPQGVVFMAGIENIFRSIKSLHLSIMSSLNARDPAERYGYHPAGYVSTSESQQSTNRARKRRYKKYIYNWGTGLAQAWRNARG